MIAGQNESLVSGEYVMTADDFRCITSLLHESSGISMNQSKATLVYSRLAKRLRLLGLKNFHHYCQLVTGENGANEHKFMLSALTTNLTRFFREPHHFTDLKKRALPSFLPTLQQGGRVRIWSAGCSNGAEPYSIAMTLLDAIPNIHTYDIRILATDIDFQMIDAARSGVYALDQLKDIPEVVRSRMMEPLSAKGTQLYRVNETVRDMVSFRELNLMQDWPMTGSFQAIFCRNVAIYFNEETQNRLWARLADKITAAGTLYIGHSERIGGSAQSRLSNTGITTYQLTKSVP